MTNDFSLVEHPEESGQCRKFVPTSIMISNLAFASLQLIMTSAVSLPVFGRSESARFVFPPTPSPNRDVDYTPAIYAAHFWKVYDRVMSARESREKAMKIASKHVRTLGISPGAIYTPLSENSDQNEIIDRLHEDGQRSEDDKADDDNDDLASRDKATLQTFEAILRKNFAIRRSFS